MLLSNEQQTDEFVMIRVRGDDDLTQDDEKKKWTHNPTYCLWSVAHVYLSAGSTWSLIYTNEPMLSIVMAHTG